MNILGIICEYNPFHNGHLYQIQQAKKHVNADYIIAVMSGNYTQRGTPAIISKYKRTEMCLNSGIDLVIELPTAYSTGSAEFFAMGAVSLLEHLGIVNYLCFGTECDDLSILSQIADILTEEPPLYKTGLKHCLKAGLSYPKSRENALAECFKNKENDIRNIISCPNNILAIEYLKALNKINSKITPISIERIGCSHNDSTNISEYSSASAIRKCIREGSTSSVKKSIPYDIAYFKYPIYEDDFSIILGSTLLKCDDFTNYFDVSTELSNKINKCKSSFVSFSTFASILKTKNISHAYINRALLHILLDIKNIEKSYISYIRILGFKKASTNLLTMLKDSSKLNIISKLADSDDYTLLKSNIYADNLYRLVCMNKYSMSLPNEYTNGLIIND